MSSFQHVLVAALAVAVLISSGCSALPDAGGENAVAGDTAGTPYEIPLWQGLPPGAEPLQSPETRVVNDKNWRPFVEIHNVSLPAVTVIRPPAGQANGSAMVVLPGGAFGILAWDVEGTEVGEFLAQRGITAFVLKYRVRDSTPEEIKAYLADPTQVGKHLKPKRGAAVQDAMQAIRILRTDAPRYGIDPDRIGMIGFSAGAITTLEVLQRADDSSRPNFAASIYGMGFEPDVPAKAPPLFMVVAKDDTMMATASADIQKAWQAAGKSSELHVLESGGHGFGLGRPGTDSMRFPGLLEAWLRSQGFIAPTS
jgi:acetyl esterase/lipase